MEGEGSGGRRGSQSESRSVNKQEGPVMVSCVRDGTETSRVFTVTAADICWILHFLRTVSLIINQTESECFNDKLNHN